MCVCVCVCECSWASVSHDCIHEASLLGLGHAMFTGIFGHGFWHFDVCVSFASHALIFLEKQGVIVIVHLLPLLIVSVKFHFVMRFHCPDFKARAAGGKVIVAFCVASSYT